MLLLEGGICVAVGVEGAIRKSPYLCVMSRFPAK